MKLAALLLFFPVLAFAQSRPSDAEIDARIQTLAEQRNEQANAAALAIARVRALEAELAAAKKDCKPEKR